MSGASVVIVENPNRDPITVAQSKVDVYRRFVDENADEQIRLAGKVTKCESAVADAKQAVKDSVSAKSTLEANLAAAVAELDAARAADPELAARLDADRERQVAQRKAELTAELDALGGN